MRKAAIVEAVAGESEERFYPRVISCLLALLASTSLMSLLMGESEKGGRERCFFIY